MSKTIFSQDVPCDKERIVLPAALIENPVAVIETDVSEKAKELGARFAQEIEDKFISDFEKEGDQMVHVSTFLVENNVLYVTYYANTHDPEEDPFNQRARFVYCLLDRPEDKTFFDIQAAGDMCSGKKIDCVYDTVLMKKDDDTLFILWTAQADGNYYRFYRPFKISTKTLGEIGVNRFKAGSIVNDFSISGIQNALIANEIPYKTLYSDIGIMQKTSSREENGETYYYTGAYSGDFTCIIKSKDFITWEYVAQPDFPTLSKWENATYVIGNKCYYFVRQHNETQYGFLTVYDLEKKTWERPVLIGDSQSRGDFIEYEGGLYLVHAPIDRDHIGIVKIDKENIKNSSVVLQAHMHSSCFYPFLQYLKDGELAMSYTVNRKHIRLAGFTLKKYL